MNRLAIGSFIIGLIALFSGLFFYLSSIDRRDPIFSIDPSRIRILYSNNISKAAIKIFKANGQEVKSDLSILKIYFWNHGKKSIRPENVLSPIIITKIDSTTNILDAKLTRFSRSISGIRLNFPDSTKNSIEIEFNILERNDGGIVQIMYEGKYDSRFLINGIIEGPGNLSFSNKKLDSSSIKWARISLAFLFICLLLAVAYGAYKGFLEAVKKWSVFKKTKEGDKGDIILNLITLPIFFGAILLFGYWILKSPLTALYLPNWLK